MKMQLLLHETIYKLLNSGAKIVSFSETSCNYRSNSDKMIQCTFMLGNERFYPYIHRFYTSGIAYFSLFHHITYITR